MTIRPESVVVGNAELVSFEVPEAELTQAMSLTSIPDDFPEPTLRGLPILEHRKTARHQRDGVDYVRVMWRYPLDPNSRVKTIHLQASREEAQRAKP